MQMGLKIPSFYISVHCSSSCSILHLCSRRRVYEVEDTLLLAQRAHALLPTHPCVRPGSGSGLSTAYQLLTHSAGLWGFALREFVWSYQNIFGMLWRSGCQRLCCLQNEEMLMAGKKARSVSILKRGRLLLFLCCMLAACKCGLQQSMGSYWEPAWLVLLF